MKKFINLSNHSSDRWSEDQKKTALELSQAEEVLDLQFPLISPEAGEADVTALAFSYLEKIRELAGGADTRDVWVHVMGEMTFVYLLVGQLKAQGYHVVASTTQRVAEERGDGTKVSTFKFVRYRAY